MTALSAEEAAEETALPMEPMAELKKLLFANPMPRLRVLRRLEPDWEDAPVLCTSCAPGTFAPVMYISIWPFEEVGMALQAMSIASCLTCGAGAPARRCRRRAVEEGMDWSEETVMLATRPKGAAPHCAGALIADSEVEVIEIVGLHWLVMKE